MSLFGTSLVITAVGMGLVFVAILLLWALMDLIMRLTQEKNETKSMKDESSTDLDTQGETLIIGNSKRKCAAVAAVAVAMALQRSHAGEVSSGSILSGASTWQAIGRAAQISQSSLVSRRR